MKRDDYLTKVPEIRESLQLAVEGTAYFDRTLDALSDSLLDGESLLPGWNRRQVLSHVAFNAQALQRLAEWAATGVEQSMYESSEARDAQLEEGARLPATQLRQLHRDSSDSLDAVWRTLSDEAWSAEVRMPKGSAFAAASTIWLRTREVWIHAVDLNSGARFDDFPPDMIDHLLANVISAWRGRAATDGIPNFVVAPSDRNIRKGVGALDDVNAVVLTGTAADLTGWATGRSQLGVESASGGPVPNAPRWI